MQNGQTNGEFANTNEEFRKACHAAGLEPTRRQASKFRLKFGRAYEAHLRAKNLPPNSSMRRAAIDTPDAFPLHTE